MKISLFKNVKQIEPVKVLLIDEYFENIKNGFWQDEVLNFRAGKLEKWKIKAVTASGEFSKRNASSLIAHSGFINIDIDAKDNPEINLLEFRSELYTDIYVYAAHLSVSGKGLTCYVKIDKKKHLKSFLAIEKYFLNTYKIQIDQSCKDISRLRFVSYDPDLYINKSAKKWDKFIKDVPKTFNQNYISTSDDFDFVMQQITAGYVDLTNDYHDWIKIGFAIAGEYGDVGRNYFHDVSKPNPNYDYEKTEKKYNNILKNANRNSTGIASFFYLAKQAGLQIKTERTKTIETIAKLRFKSVGESGGMKDKLSAGESAKKYLKEQKEIQGADVDEIIEQVSKIPPRFIENQEKTDIEIIEDYLSLQRFEYNEVTGKLESGWIEVSDIEINSAFLDCRNLNKKINKNLFDIVIKSNRVNKYNPFLRFIEKYKHLKPKGNIEAALSCINDEMFLENTQVFDYKDVYVKKWMLSIIASLHGTYSLMILVLTGAQGTNKTNWFRGLLPDELKKYYAESKLDLGKDDEILMTNKLLIIDDEFGGKSKQEAKKLKDLSSKQFFTIRRPYGRTSEDLLRIAVLGGTSNDDEVLNDPTGNRRIIPLKIKTIDIDKFNKIDKTELFIELYHEWEKIGDGWMLSRDEIRVLNDATVSHEQAVAEHDLVNNFYEIDDNYTFNVKTIDIKVFIEQRTNQKLSLYKLASNLKKLGYKQKIKRKGRNVIRVWNMVQIVTE